MHALKWYKESTRMFFAGGGIGGDSSPPSSAPPSGGDGGGSVAPAAPAGGEGQQAPTSQPSSPAPASTEPAAPAAPVTPAPAAPVPTPTDDMWANLGSADDLDFLALQPPTLAPPAPPVAPAAATPPAGQQTPPAAQPGPQAPQPAAPAAPAPTSQAPGEPAARPLSASDPVGIAEAMEANRDAVIAHLATTKFALSEDDIKELDTDVIAAVPKLLSRVFMESQMSMQRFLAQSVPGMVKQYQTVTTANNDAEKKFFDTHKALDIGNPQHRQTAVRLATLYRQANPNMPLDQLIQEVGPVVMAAVKANAPAASPTAPPRGGAPPFRPAVNGGGGSSPVADAPNEWAGMGQTYDDG